MAKTRATALDLGLDAVRSDPARPLSPVERLRRLAALEHGDLTVIVVYAVAIGLVSLAVPIAAQSLVNTVAFTALLQPLVVLSALVLLGLFAAGALRAFQYRVVETLQQRFFVRLTHDSARRITRSDVRAFADQGATEVMNRFFDVATVQKTAATLLLDGLSVVLQGGVSLILLAFYHPALLAFDVVLIALIAFTVFGLGRGGVSTAVKESKVKYATAAWLEEIARALRTFKPDPSARFAFRRADDLARAYVEARQKHFKVLFRQVVASYVLQACATAALLGLGGSLVIKGQLTLGQLVAAELIVTGVLAGVAKFGKYLESYYDLCASLDKVGAIVDLREERDGGVRPPPRSGPARLKLDGVAFAYNENAQALRDVSLEIRPGTRLAVLGSDASGKSTLVDVLYGLRSPSRGQVLLDGIDVRTLSLSDLRRDVALVGEPEIVDGTVLDNLTLGHDRVDIALASHALESVALSGDIADLPEGPATRLGHEGSRLTSSQAARLAIARCLVSQPRLLIIDQTLDGLGTETARMVLRGIASAQHHASVIVFTSREEIAEAVGHVMRLDRGVLREESDATLAESVAE
ncbi:MAG TPA: ABC transporter ATP-binding protein [Labilithrix sp.]|nr:ABC transporter ATP-binding protein [Labilithrix sp.]